MFLQTGKGGTWYWNNAKTRGEGSDDFKKLWGDRENEDNWRRSEKVIEANFIEINGEKIVDTVEVAYSDTLNVDYLTSKLPLTDSAIALSNKRLLEAHYNAGIIYKEQLKEPGIATEEFKQVINKNIENEHNLLSAFQLYKIFETSNVSEANRYKEYILKNYPNSDYANYLIDPNYFLKKKERDVLAEQEYVTVLGRYGRGLYYPVLTKANIVINNEINNVYRAKYMLLKAMAKGQLTEDKNQLLPVLDSLVTEYPGSDEAIRGQEMIDIIKNGYSENIESDFGSKYPFIYNERADSKVLVFLEKNQSSNLAKSKVVDFQREFFSRLSLKVSSKIYTSDESVILITGFKDESEANEYIRVYKKTRKYLLDLQNAKIFIITSDNMKILFQKQNLEEYENYYDEYY